MKARFEREAAETKERFANMQKVSDDDNARQREALKNLEAELGKLMNSGKNSATA